jgi:hypothetical protein
MALGIQAFIDEEFITIFASAVVLFGILLYTKMCLYYRNLLGLQR